MKKRGKIFYCLGGLLYMIGMGCMLFSLSNVVELLEIESNIATIIKSISIISIISAIILLIFGIIRSAGTNEEININENDERNVMIRGKASEITTTVSSLVNCTVLMICVVMENWILVGILAAALIINTVTLLLANTYYQKKY